MAAPGDIFICDIAQQGTNQGFLPEQVAVAVGPEGEPSYVTDPIIIFYHKGPIEATVTTDNDSRLSAKWKVKVTEDGRQIFTLLYEIRVLKADLTAKISVTGNGDYKVFTAPGSCQKTKAKG